MPACWATLPVESPLRIGAELDQLQTSPEALTDRMGVLPDRRFLLSATDDWIIERPAAGAVVVLEGLVAGHLQLSFPLPQLRVLADYSVGGRTGTIELWPQTLVVLTEEQRLFIVYSAVFRTAYDPSTERSLRVRTSTGWFS